MELEPDSWLRRATVAVVDLLAVAVILGPVLLFAILPTDGPGSGSSNTANAAARTTATTGLPAPAHRKLRGPAAALLAEVDPAIRRNCVRARHPGGVATLLCSATGSKLVRIDLHVDRFGRPAILLQALRNEAIASLVKAGGKRPVAPRTRSGRCNATTWLGTMRWRTAPGPGFAVCFVARGSAEDCGRLNTTTCAVIYWTYQPEDLYVRAAAPAGKTAELYTWWREHRDRFGRG